MKKILILLFLFFAVNIYADTVLEKIRFSSCKTAEKFISEYNSTYNYEIMAFSELPEIDKRVSCSAMFDCNAKAWKLNNIIYLK